MGLSNTLSDGQSYQIARDASTALVIVTEVYMLYSHMQMHAEHSKYAYIHIYMLAQSAGAVEYTDCTSAEG